MARCLNRRFEALGKHLIYCGIFANPSSCRRSSIVPRLAAVCPSLLTTFDWSVSPMAFRTAFIGINKHSDPGMPALAGACRDAAALHASFTDTFDDLRASLLLDDAATLSAIRPRRPVHGKHCSQDGPPLRGALENRAEAYLGSSQGSAKGRPRVSGCCFLPPESGVPSRTPI
jgi:hypothetical protein